jgi:hypothetical protein
LKLAAVRKLALALPDTTEEPHHTYGSFRVRGRIFVTIPPGDELIHVFLPDEQRDLALALDPEFIEPVHWGSKVPCVRIKLSAARASTVAELVRKAHEFKAALPPARPKPRKDHR